MYISKMAKIEFLLFLSLFIVVNGESTIPAPSVSTIEHDITTSQINVRKCCLSNQAFFVSENSCADFDIDFDLPIYMTNNYTYQNISSDEINFAEGLLSSCAPSILNAGEFVIFDTGHLFSPELDEYFDPDKYCLEHIVNNIDEPNDIRLTAAYCPNSEIPAPYNPNKIPVRKCCLIDEMVASHSAECILRQSDKFGSWRAPMEGLGPLFSDSENFTTNFETVPGYPECIKMERGESLLQSIWDFGVSTENGLLSVPSLEVETQNFCIDDYQSDNDTLVSFAYVCLSEESHAKFSQKNRTFCGEDGNICIQKCCPLDQMLNQDGHCVKDEKSLFYSDYIPIQFQNGSTSVASNFEISFGPPSCHERDYFVTKERERGTLMENGSLRYSFVDESECGHQVVEYVPQKDYCYDMVKFRHANGLFSDPVRGALICFPGYLEDDLRRAEQINFIYSIFLGISDVFILISFVIYLTVPDQAKRGLNKNVKLGHSVLGRIILCFLFSLFVAYLCLIVTKNASDAINLASKNACIALGIIMYVVFLATFFWLNTLCFELWWKCARQERASGRRWIWYQIYAWGMPLVLGGAVLYIEFSPSFGPCFVKPNFGKHSCFFSETRTFGSTAKWLYLNGPIALLLIADLVFFLLTVKSLMQTVQQSHAGTVKRQARQRLKLCFKLFLVMGICWMTEIISAATSTRKWYVAEIFNCLQGFVIFLIFILKPKILHAVRENVCSVCCGKKVSRDSLRGKLTFTASVLSDFLSSTKRSHPSVTSQNLSTSSFSTSSTQFSWGSNISRTNCKIPEARLKTHKKSFP